MSQPLPALTTVSYRDVLYDMLIGLFLSICDWFSKYLDPLIQQSGSPGPCQSWSVER